MVDMVAMAGISEVADILIELGDAAIDMVMITGVMKE
jgi:hypothetical protein